MSDIVVSTVKKVNILDKIIQNVVIMVNMSKMNRAIDEHLQVINETDRDDQRIYQENILREIVYVKYQYDIMQRTMYELKMPYSEEIVENINSVDKTDRYNLQKEFLEMEYERITKLKFKNKEDIKYMLLIISSVIGSVKQNIKDEGKNLRYNQVIKCAEEIDGKIKENTYTDTCYTQLFAYLDAYVSYINDNYDISKLPDDEKDIIELVIESTINGIESDIERLNYQYDLIINICKNSYRYFGIIDKIFDKLQKIYEESLERQSINVSDYIKFYKNIYDKKIKTMVNDVHRTIKIEDEYLDYSKALKEDVDLEEYILRQALITTGSEETRKIVEKELKKYVSIEDEDGQEVLEEVGAEAEIKSIENEKNITEVVIDNIQCENQVDVLEDTSNVDGTDDETASIFI